MNREGSDSEVSLKLHPRGSGKQCLFCWHLAGGAWLTFVAVTEPQERDEIPVMRVSTTTRHTQDSEQIVPEWMKERRGPRPLIPRDFHVAEADRLA